MLQNLLLGQDFQNQLKRVKKYQEGETIYNIEDGKFVKERPQIKALRENLEGDIEYTAKGITEGKFKNIDITDIIKDVENKEKRVEMRTEYFRERERLEEKQKIKDTVKNVVGNIYEFFDKLSDKEKK